MTKLTKHAAAVAFFHEHAGFAYDPKRETEAQGRLRRARQLAAGEAWAQEEGYSFDWQEDPYSTSAAWIESGEDGGPDRNPWATWYCHMIDAGGEEQRGLYGVDFGRDGQPWGDPYRRVVEAELAAEEYARSEQEEV
jgi:hypothetical protein